MITSKAQIIDLYKDKLSKDKNWAIKGLMVIYARQTADEQQEGNVRVKNGQGFVPTDANFLSSLAEQYKVKRTFSEKQLEILYKKMPKYARQLMGVSIDSGRIIKVGREYRFK